MWTWVNNVIRLFYVGVISYPCRKLGGRVSVGKRGCSPSSQLSYFECDCVETHLIGLWLSTHTSWRHGINICHARLWPLLIYHMNLISQHRERAPCLHWGNTTQCYWLLAFVLFNSVCSEHCRGWIFHVISPSALCIKWSRGEPGGRGMHAPP